ncbi:hypothetical protein BB561_005191 [Smittium simulii]|uniref:Alpha-1,3-mannosyltransferase CMT1 n=1 Tax=Smittium simulii TaxID=133385 RepID=A0A2T9YBL7_9FUNG|nr:hypothetical protein BB561_005191 [Smittium simulii]
MNLYNNEAILPYIFAELFRVFEYLGPDNIFISLYENGSKDATRNVIRMFKNSLQTWNIEHLISTEKAHKPEKWHRIEYLAKVRNKALKPLYEQEKRGIKYDKILFINDAIFCRNDILELIYQSDLQQSDITCPLDFDMMKGENNKNIIGFRDTWVARDLGGDSFNKNLNAMFAHKDTFELAKKKLPFQAQCCWNGAAVLNSEPFYGNDPVKFRRSYLKYDECSASECSLMCNDFWEKNYRRVVVVPRILLPYEIDHFKELDNQLPQEEIPESELVSYVKGPEKIFCHGLDELNSINPGSPARHVRYTSNDTYVY